MADELIAFVIDGGNVRNGNVPASVFAAKFTAFLSTMYALERVYSRESKRQVDLEVVRLSRESPSRIGMRATAKTSGYDADAAITWGVKQLGLIREGRADPLIPENVLASVIALADYRTDKTADIGLMQVECGGEIVSLDGVLAGHAMVARARATETLELPWRPGVSRGSVFGELVGVMDLDGERQFYIRPPSGPVKVQCIFSEHLRDKMVKNLFGVVRASGFLHYDGRSPHPHLLDADHIEGQATPETHMLDLAGAFAELDFESFIDEMA